MIIPRQITPSLKEHLVNSSKILALLGPRQVGKTTLIKELLEEIKKENGISPRNVFTFSLDDTEILAKWQSNPKEIIKTIEFSLGKPLSEQQEKVFLFIDEAQKAPAIFDILKLLHDNHKDKIKIIISGSSSLLIRQKSAETLTGRINLFHLGPLSWREIASYAVSPISPTTSIIGQICQGKLEWKDTLAWNADFYRQSDKTKLYWNQLLLYGGLPEVFLSTDSVQKTTFLRDYLKTYLEKEIRLLSEVGDIDLFTKILTSIFVQDAKLLNLTKLAEQFGVNRHTLRKYYSILKETFLLKSLEPQISKNRQRAVKSEKIIFFDNGLVNYLAKISSMEQLLGSPREGTATESVIINGTIAATTNMPMPPELRYWRDYNDNEIDLVIDNGQQVIPIEITTATKPNQDKIRNFSAFWKSYPQSPFGILLYSGDPQQISVGEKKLYLLPHWLWW